MDQITAQLAQLTTQMGALYSVVNAQQSQEAAASAPAPASSGGNGGNGGGAPTCARAGCGKPAFARSAAEGGGFHPYCGRTCARLGREAQPQQQSPAPTETKQQLPPAGGTVPICPRAGCGQPCDFANGHYRETCSIYCRDLCERERERVAAEKREDERRAIREQDEERRREADHQRELAKAALLEKSRARTIALLIGQGFTEEALRLSTAMESEQGAEVGGFTPPPKAAAAASAAPVVGAARQGKLLYGSRPFTAECVDTVSFAELGPQHAVKLLSGLATHHRPDPASRDRAARNVRLGAEHEIGEFGENTMLSPAARQDCDQRAAYKAHQDTKKQPTKLGAGGEGSVLDTILSALRVPPLRVVTAGDVGPLPLHLSRVVSRHSLVSSKVVASSGETKPVFTRLTWIARMAIGGESAVSIGTTKDNKTATRLYGALDTRKAIVYHKLLIQQAFSVAEFPFPRREHEPPADSADVCLWNLYLAERRSEETELCEILFNNLQKLHQTAGKGSRETATRFHFLHWFLRLRTFLPVFQRGNDLFERVWIGSITSPLADMAIGKEDVEFCQVLQRCLKGYDPHSKAS